MSTTRPSGANGESLVVAGQQLLRITQFDPESMEWTYWKKRLKNHLFLTKVPDPMQSSFLLDSLTSKPFELLCKMCKPKEPMDVPVKELYEKLDAAYQEPTFWISQRVKFFSTKQKPDETLVQFACELRDKVEHCDFPEAEVEKNLVAVFVMGMNNDVTKRMLSLKDLKDLNEALTDAKESEMKRKELGIEPVSDNDVKKVRKGQGKQNKRERKEYSRERNECYRCGKRNHSSSECFFKEKECHECGEKGHIARMCSKMNKYIREETEATDVF